LDIANTGFLIRKPKSRDLGAAKRDHCQKVNKPGGPRQLGVTWHSPKGYVSNYRQIYEGVQTGED